MTRSVINQWASRISANPTNSRVVDRPSVNWWIGRPSGWWIGPVRLVDRPLRQEGHVYSQPGGGDPHSVRSEMLSVASINMELLTEFDTVSLTEL